MTTNPLRPTVALLLAGLVACAPARAAESYDACVGFIDSVPTTISTQGTWCLRKDLSTNITNGYALTVASNNVTIDCNDFKIGGLAAGNDSTSFGIYAAQKQNVAVRHCNIRGFFYGIHLAGGAGHLVEDNRLDDNLYFGIYLTGENNRVRGNAVYDTGGKTGLSYAHGIYAHADIIDNTISGLFADRTGGILYGIRAFAAGAQVRDNTVSGFDTTPVQGGAANWAYGIDLYGYRQRASGNHVAGGDSNNLIGTGLYARYPAACLGNSVGGFNSSIDAKCTGTGNVVLP